MDTIQTRSRYRNRVLPKARLRRAAMWATAQWAACCHSISGRRQTDGFGILMYHRVADRASDVAPPTWNVTPARLREQLSGLLSRGFEAWPLGRVIDAHRASRRVRSNVFVVTFDDGYANNYLSALPVLKELQVPATVFLATEYLDSDRPFPFDDWSGRGSDRVGRVSWKPLTTDQCRQMASDDLVELGAHTHSHGDFRADPDRFERDLAVNLEILESRFGVRRPPFAFPYGWATASMMEIVRCAGLTCGLTTVPALNHAEASPFGWGRFDVAAWDTGETLAARLSGWGEFLYKVQRRLVAWRRAEFA